MVTTPDICRFIVRPGIQGGADPILRAGQARALGLSGVRSIQRACLYFVRGTITPEERELLGRFLLADPVTETVGWENPDGSLGGELPARTGTLPCTGYSPGCALIEVALKPGVTDPVAEEILRAAPELGIKGIDAVCTGESYEIEGDRLETDALELLATRLFANPVIQRHAVGRIEPAFPFDAKGSVMVEQFDLAAMDDTALASLSRTRRSALDEHEMAVIRDYYRREGRQCTDIEFEMIAQTWSEHCVHKTFRADIEIQNAPDGSPYSTCPGGLPSRVRNILKTYIKRVTDEIDAPWVLSSFVDNAGIIEFSDTHELSFKVETHNHPSAIEPFGGANTGVGGVIRDIMGVSARPVAVTDVLCFGPADTPRESIPSGALDPARIMSGVVAGVQDYGNKMGIPNVNGGVHFDPGYSANPLVFCGCAGIAPRGLHRSGARPKDRVVVVGGKTGRDGIRGATFSSMVMDSTTQEVAGSSVQIGDPITEKKVADVIVLARDRGLYSAITDCGAGGLSSAIGEMASVVGCDVELERVPLKYPGLTPWEIWLSEAQERMVLAVPPESLPEFREICLLYDVIVTDLGEFTGSGRLVVRHRDVRVCDLDCAFLHEGIPVRKLFAAPPASRPDPFASSGDDGADCSEPARRGPGTAEILLSLLAHPAIASKEQLIRLYDHEVQGSTVLRPYDGVARDAPQDAAVLVPRESDGRRGFALSNGFNPKYGKLDAYRMAVSAVDEAVRNAVAVGVDPDRTAVLDNFCWGDPGRPEVMWTLVDAARGCHDAALLHRTPFISGKDSFNNEYVDAGGKRVSIPPSLLVSAIGIVPDATLAPGSDLKMPDSFVYLCGEFNPVLGGSVFAELYPDAARQVASGTGAFARDGAEVPAISSLAPRVYRALHAAIGAGCVASCHDLSEGGLAVALAEMIAGGHVGARVDAESFSVLHGAAMGDSISGCTEDGSRCPGPGEAAAVRLLFGETNGCLLVEVSRENEARFLSVMEGLPAVRIAVTTAHTEFGLDRVEGMHSSLSLEGIVAAMKSPFGFTAGGEA